MSMRIKAILADSPASEMDFAVGDIVLAVNGRTDLEDQFDYQFEVFGEPVVLFRLQRAGLASPLELRLEKDEDDDPGLVFESPVFTPIKTCNNACPFCFIDQQPPGLRPTLYVKDDDWRLSYFANTYITLTNLTRRDRERIEMLRPGPLYVSVHSTVPHVRQKLLMNAKAGEVMTELNWLKSLDIPFHAQLVICPELNDDETFSQTLADLWTLRPACESVAVVPLGLTQHRGDLPMLKAHTQASASQLLDRLQAFVSAHSDSADWVFASDEFYVHAQRPLPGYEQYGEFPQLDDGVGTARLLTQQFFEAAESFPEQLDTPENILILTGELGGMVLMPFAQRFNQIVNLYVDVVPIKSQFWGDSVTVAGLITGRDILAALSNQAEQGELKGYSRILIPDTMVRSDYDGRDNVFLDGLDVASVSQTLGVPIEVVPNPSQAASLINTVLGQNHVPS